MRSFLRQVLATVVGVGVFVALVFVLFASWLAEEPGPPVPDPGYLVLDGALVISDAGGPADPAALLAGAPSALPLRRVLQGIDAARDDERIRGLVLVGSIEGGGWPARQALRAALADFRDAGKEIIAHGTDWDEADYFLASLADECSLAPFGTLSMDGLAAEVLYLADALDALGVGVQVARVGDYKAAAEPLVSPRMSEENRAQIAALLADFERIFLEGVSAARGVTVEELRTRIAERGLWSARAAAEAGLVDRVAYLDEILDALQDRVGADVEHDGFAQIGFRDWLDEHERRPALRERELRIHVVYAEGTIVDGEGPGEVGGDALARRLRDLRTDADADAVVLRVNSPGGSASASEVILREVRRLAAEKPVIVSMGEVAASGGYWIACGADAVVAHPTTITGSIGVFALLPNLAGSLEKTGVRVETVKTAEHADLASPWRARSAEEMAVVQGFVQEVYDGFVERVADARSLDPARVEELARGRVWSGAAALERGLVDRLGGLDDAIALAGERLDADRWQVVYHEPRPETWERLLSEALQGEDPPLVTAPAAAWRASLRASPLGELAAAAAPALAARDASVLALLPGRLSVR